MKEKEKMERSISNQIREGYTLRRECEKGKEERGK